MSKKRTSGTRKKEIPKEHNERFFKSTSQPKSGSSFFSSVQTKLKIGEPGDKYEKQADAMADRVVNTPSKTPALQTKETDSKVQRQGTEEETQAKLQRQGEEEEVQTQVQKQEEEETQTKLQKQEEEETQAKVQKQEEEEMQTKLQKQEEEEVQTKLQRQEEEEPTQTKLQRKEKTESVATPEFENKIASTRSGGSPLPKEVRDEMEQKFGTSFKRVKIHADPISYALCEEISAQAFTRGNHIYFNRGKFQPGTREGRLLLAHELTHVVQQRSPM